MFGLELKSFVDIREVFSKTLADQTFVLIVFKL